MLMLYSTYLVHVAIEEQARLAETERVAESERTLRELEQS